MKNSLPILFLVALLFSCQKDIVFPEGAGSGTPPTGSKGGAANILSGTSWKLTGYTVNIDYGGGIIVDTDLYSAIPTCSLDDIHTFNANGTATDNAGNIKCNSSDAQSVESGTWKLSEDQKKLTLSSTIPNVAGITSLEAELLELTSEKFVMRYITYANGPKTTNVATYTRVR